MGSNSAAVRTMRSINNAERLRLDRVIEANSLFSQLRLSPINT